MEVHHHSHTSDPPDGYRDPRGRKNWTHYFWDFLMLFLAVTLGFFVENQREHYIEHQRERQYMKTMVQDLRDDIVLLHTIIEDFNNKIPAFDTIISEFPHLSKQFSAPFARNVFKIVAYEDLVPNDRTLQQLKNAGGMRLIRKNDVSDSIMAYDKKMKDLLIEQEGLYDFYIKYRDRGELLNAELLQNTRLPGFIEQYETDNTILLVSPDKALLSKYLSYAQSYRAIARLYILQLRDVAEYAVRLINFIQSEYHLT